MGLATGVVAGVLVLLGAAPPVASPGPTVVTVRGRILTLDSALRSLDLELKLDPGSASKQVVLLGEDRSITPLFRDEITRALFEDGRLRNLRAELHGRHYPGVPYLKVTSLRVEHDGQLQIPEYFCEVCSISVRAPQICPCCQGPMILQMRPDRR